MGTSLVYTDACTSMGGEEETDTRRAASVVVACSPSRWSEKATEGAIHSPHAIVYDRSENRPHLQKAIFPALLFWEELW